MSKFLGGRPPAVFQKWGGPTPATPVGDAPDYKYIVAKHHFDSLRMQGRI